MNAARRTQRVRSMLAVATALSMIAGVGACRRSGEGSRPTTLNPASSEVMGNTAGAAGTPGDSGAARRAGSAPASPSATASAAPVTSTPAAAANAGSATGAGD